MLRFRWFVPVIEEAHNAADNFSMLRRLIVLLLLCAVLGQSCWAFGELLHSHESHDVGLDTSAMGTDRHSGHHEHDGDDRVSDRDDCPSSDFDDHHHHSCTSHSPFGPPTLNLHLITGDQVLSNLYFEGYAPDAPLTGIDRLNWRVPA